jgi:hypothetical protein
MSGLTRSGSSTYRRRFRPKRLELSSQTAMHLCRCRREPDHKLDPIRVGSREEIENFAIVGVDVRETRQRLDRCEPSEHVISSDEEHVRLGRIDTSLSVGPRTTKRSQHTAKWLATNTLVRLECWNPTLRAPIP